MKLCSLSIFKIQTHFKYFIISSTCFFQKVICTCQIAKWIFHLSVVLHPIDAWVAIAAILIPLLAGHVCPVCVVWCHTRGEICFLMACYKHCASSQALRGINFWWPQFSVPLMHSVSACKPDLTSRQIFMSCWIGKDKKMGVLAPYCME